MSDGGKGHKPRPIPDPKKFEENWDKIFKKKEPIMDFTKHNRIMNDIYPNSHWANLPKDTDKE